MYGAEPAQTHQVAGNDQRGARQSQNGVVQPLQPQEHRLGTTGMRQAEIGCFSSPKPLLNQLCTGKVIKKGAAGVERTRQPNASCWRNSFDEKCFALSKEIAAGIQQEGLAAMLWTGARRFARWEQPVSLSVALLSSRNVIRKRITGHGMLQPRGYLHTLTKINSPGSVIAEQYLQGLVVPCTTRGTGEDGCKISSKMKNWRIRDV